MAALNSDILGVVAGFLAPTTAVQRPLMLVSRTWRQGVIEQDGMAPKPDMKWDWDALRQRQPRKLWLDHDEGTCGAIALLIGMAPLLEELRELSLSYCKGITAVVLTSLQAFPALERLQLQYAPDIGGDIVESICRLSSLQHLDISGYDALGDAELAELATQLPKLETLVMSGCKGVTNAGLHHVATKMLNLKELDIFSCNMVTDEGLVTVCDNLRSLEVLNINCLKETTIIGWEHIAKLEHLRELGIRFLPITGELLRRLVEAVPKLEKLDCCFNQQLTDDDLKVISTLTHLTYLDVSFNKDITDIGVQHLCSLVGLTFLSLESCKKVTDEGVLAVCAALVNLEELDIHEVDELTDRGIENIANLSKLTTLTLYNCSEISANELLSVAKCTCLTSLNLNFCGVGDDGVTNIASSMHKLTNLELVSNEITDASLDHLVEIGKHLKELSLCYNDEFSADAESKLRDAVGETCKITFARSERFVRRDS